MKLLDNLYAYVWQGTDNNCNTYVFSEALSNGKNVVIDPGHVTTPFYKEPGLEKLLSEMETDEIGGAGIGLVILTHAHPDHCEAAVTIKEKNGALVALHEADEATYRGLDGKVDLYLQEGNWCSKKINKLKLNVYHTPGHSPGHTALYWPDQKVLIAVV